MWQSFEKTLSVCSSALLKLYRLSLAPLFMSLGVRCRFEPSCSHYAEEAIRRHGIKGLGFTIYRLVRCHPFCQGGWDPVPPRE